MQADCLVVGQGICGTMLSYYLERAGLSVVVVDNGNPSSASRVASGVINPVTGKRLVTTWMAAELHTFSRSAYRQLEQELNVPILSETSILDFHTSPDQQALFAERAAESSYFGIVPDEVYWAGYFRFNYGIGAIAPVLLVDLHALLPAWRSRLLAAGRLLEQDFDINDLTVQSDGIQYRDITAQRIIFCDGTASMDSRYFGLLPWSKDKGEVIIASIEGLPLGHIYKQGYSIVPWKDGQYWIGATHDWKYTDMQPSPGFRRQVEELLGYWLKLPYHIHSHLVSARPVNFERKPLVGMHPVHSAVGIFNGMGTKGCSMAPWFAQQFASHLAAGTPIDAAVDIKRFSRVLSR